MSWFRGSCAVVSRETFIRSFLKQSESNLLSPSSKKPLNKASFNAQITKIYFNQPLKRLYIIN